MLNISQVHINSQAINFLTQLSTIILKQISTGIGTNQPGEALCKLNRQTCFLAFTDIAQNL
jgi:hypothetical protein